MDTNCIECTRLLQVSSEALKSHRMLLAQIYRAHYDPAMLWKLEPSVRGAVGLRRDTRKAFENHQAICRN